MALGAPRHIDRIHAFQHDAFDGGGIGFRAAARRIPCTRGGGFCQDLKRTIGEKIQTRLVRLCDESFEALADDRRRPADANPRRS